MGRRDTGGAETSGGIRDESWEGWGGASGERARRRRRRESTVPVQEGTVRTSLYSVSGKRTLSGTGVTRHWAPRPGHTGSGGSGVRPSSLESKPLPFARPTRVSSEEGSRTSRSLSHEVQYVDETPAQGTNISCLR